MGLSRFFAEGPLPADGVLPLPEGELHHLRDVLRLRSGDEIEVVADGVVWRVILSDVGGEVRGARISQVTGAGLLQNVTLAAALAKGEKIDVVVRQATEIGVRRIVPFGAERSIVRLPADKALARTERWRRIAVAAAKQAHRIDVPEITRPVALSELPRVLGDTTILVAFEGASRVPGAVGIAEALAERGVGPADAVCVIVGPEGGLTDAEVALLVESGAVCVSLGDTILRTETAGVVATALTIHTLGGLGGRRD